MMRVAAIALVAILSAPAAWADPVAGEFDPETGYRMSRYQAPVPDEVPGGRRVNFEEVERHVRDGTAILIDVMPTDGSGAHPETGEWHLKTPHKDIPGSVWLPDVGRGRLDPGLAHYFQSNLEHLTQGNKARPIVVYCQADCWMGWNAAKRAAEIGYTSVLWYPEGRDGWRDWDGTVADAVPVPMQPADARLRLKSSSVPVH